MERTVKYNHAFKLCCIEEVLKKNRSKESVDIENGISQTNLGRWLGFHINFVKDATLVGHNVNLDIEMINQALKRLDLGRLKNPIMDTNTLYQRWKDLPDDSHISLDELCDALKIGKSDRHTASGNAYTTALVFLKLKRKLGI